MKGIVRRRGQARKDLIDIFRQLARKASLGTAGRFFAQADATFQRLADMPDMGSLYEPDNPAFVDIRFFPISRFKKYLVFYLPTAQGVDIVRILHGSRDISGILAEDFGIDSDYDPSKP